MRLGVWSLGVLGILLMPSLALAEGGVGAGFGDTNVTFRHRNPETPENHRNIGNEVLYQVVVDRFFQGIRDRAPLYDGQFSSPDRSDWTNFWGGDLPGVIEKLPYMKELGITRLWLTPVFEPQLMKVEDPNSGKTFGPYHNYWWRDLFRLNPFFTRNGSTDYDAVRDLVSTALPDIKIYLDSVMNHSSPDFVPPKSAEFLAKNFPLPAEAGGEPTRSQGGMIFANGHYVIDYAEDARRMAADPSYVPAYNHNQDKTNLDERAKAEYPELYEQDPALARAVFENERFSLQGLSDINYDNQKARQLMNIFHYFWMKQIPGLAGFRLDAVPNVPIAFWKQLTEKLKKRYPNIELIGEIFARGSGDWETERAFHQTGMTTFDFRSRYALQDVLLHNHSFSKIVDVWKADEKLGDARPLITFIDNHDVSRLRSEGMTFDRMKQALGLLFASRGVPAIYYGLEQDLFTNQDQKEKGDPYNRPMMTSFDTNSPLFKLTQTLIAARKANPAFRYGDTHVVHQTDHMLAFERVHGTDKAFFMTSKNPREGEDHMTIRGLTLPDGEYHDVLSGKAYTVRNGEVAVAIADGGMILLSTSPPKSQAGPPGCRWAEVAKK